VKAAPTAAPLDDERVFVGLGANLGDATATLGAAIAAIGALPGTRVVARSSFYRSAPVQAAGPDFINAAIELRTTLDPLALLDALQGIEARFGRERPYPNAPRTLDLDLLFFGQRRLAGERLSLPHPRAHERAFVLVPLAEVAPDITWPAAPRGQAVERIEASRAPRPAVRA
jgi:2-amino-4-hydroxy-6-hydroxymethyldihydropteridine diphosphokinase